MLRTDAPADYRSADRPGWERGAHGYSPRLDRSSEEGGSVVNKALEIQKRIADYIDEAGAA